MDPVVARRLWTLYEPVHAVTYFAPQVTAAWEAAGVTGFWRGYFAGRAAPLAPCPPEVVTATFFGFAPAFVARAVPAVWDRVDPATALRARVDGAVAALDVALGPATGEDGVAADLLARAARATEVDGRALAAANVALPWPEGTRAVLWHAATILREHRGDAHVAACVAAGLTGLEANILAVAAGPLTAERFKQVRGWTPEEWAAARAVLARRGHLDGDGAVTPAGTEVRAAVEVATDRASVRPWEALGPDAVTRLDAALAPVVTRLLATGVIPDPNPIGVPRPT